VSERTADRLLSLPMFAELTSDQIEYVVECIREYVEGGTGYKVHGARK
jgi:dTDP-4-amino-4,6-dideoxygalactose transaminase